MLRLPASTMSKASVKPISCAACPGRSLDHALSAAPLPSVLDEVRAKLKPLLVAVGGGSKLPNPHRSGRSDPRLEFLLTIGSVSQRTTLSDLTASALAASEGARLVP